MDPALINPINLGLLARYGPDCPKYAATQILEFNVGFSMWQPVGSFTSPDNVG